MAGELSSPMLSSNSISHGAVLTEHFPNKIRLQQKTTVVFGSGVKRRSTLNRLSS
jgi:hypothetical protein